MASFTLGPSDRFPAGTSVGAYPRSNWPAVEQSRPTGTPPGAAAATATTSANNTTAFTGLTAGVWYWAYAQVGGQDRYVQFQVPAAAVGGLSSDPLAAGAYTSRLNLVPSDSADEIGLTIQRPNDDVWGVGSGYGKGQFLELLRKDFPPVGTGTAGAIVDPDDRVLFRIQRDGGFGTAGGVHVGTGQRQDAGYSVSQAVWVNPYVDTRELVLDKTNAPTKTLPYLVCQDGTGVKHRIGPAGISAVRVSNTAAQAIANNTATALTWDTEAYDTDTMHSTSSNTGRLVATTAGLYSVFANVSFAANATGVRQVYLRRNGTTTELSTLFPSVSAGGAAGMTVAGHLLMAATDYIEVVVVQTSGGSLNIGTNSYAGMAYLGLG